MPKKSRKPLRHPTTGGRVVCVTLKSYWSFFLASVPLTIVASIWLDAVGEGRRGGSQERSTQKGTTANVPPKEILMRFIVHALLRVLQLHPHVVHGIFFLGSFLPHDRVLGFGTGAQAALDTRAAAYFTVVDRPQGGVEPAQVAAETVGGLLQATRVWHDRKAATRRSEPRRPVERRGPAGPRCSGRR